MAGSLGANKQSRSWVTQPGKAMRLSEALEEAYKRWGESAAIHKDRSRERAYYQVGYFRSKGDGLVFYVMGGGSSLEKALATAQNGEAIVWQGEPDPRPARQTD